MTLQNFIDELIKSLLTVDNTLPTAVKYLFDLFDSAVVQHNITDPEVAHTWKSNSLPLRFWVNVITNPQFVFDVGKSEPIDSCLQVIASAFMESCSLSDFKLGKDSPSSKLLFAKDIPRYRGQVSAFYEAIRGQPVVSHDDMQQAMLNMSRDNVTGFNVEAAVNEIFQYAKRFAPELMDALGDDPSARKLHLLQNFEEIISSSEQEL